MSEKAPKLEEGYSFLDWKREISIWQLSTALTPARQAPTAIMAIKNKKARDFATRLDPDKLKAADGTGMTYLLTELGKHFAKDRVQTVFVALEDLESFRRSASMTMMEYISDFECKVNHVSELLSTATEQKTPYDDGVLAYRLLKQANLTKDQEILAIATVKTDLTFDQMKDSLKRAFGDVVVNDQRPGRASGGKLSLARTADDVKIKVEPEEAFVQYDDRKYDDNDTYESQEDLFYSSDKRRGNVYQYRGNRGSYRGKGDNNRGRGRGYYQKHGNSYGNSRGSGNSHHAKPVQNYNPAMKNSAGRRCHTCESTMHFSPQCPHNPDITMFTSNWYQCMYQDVDTDYDSLLLVSGTKCRALIDTGATQNVCGDLWLSDFMENLPEEVKTGSVTVSESDKTFRFGDGRTVVANKLVSIPVSLCEDQFVLNTYVVDGTLPLLLSRATMKDWGVILDIRDDKIQINGVRQNLIVTDSGHYVAEIMDDTNANQIMLTSEDSCKPEKMAIKLHRFFGHPKSARLISMVKDSDYCSKDLIKEIQKLDDKCEQCVTHRRVPPRPKSSMCMSADVNEVVSMDLKKLSTNDWMIHVIDMFSRFSATSIIPDKKAETIIDKLYTIWIVIFGPPKTWFSDNGGEFVNSEFTSMSESLGITILTSAAQSPFSNGICERHNSLISVTFDKIIDEVGCSPHVALSWATYAKNSLCNSYGYSPYMLTMGRNPQIPGLDEVKSVTTLNESVVSKLLADHLNAMNKSRTAFLEANNSDRLKRALRSRIPEVETEYFTGDKVYFKKAQQKKWCGPATVIGKDGKLVYLRQGGSIFRVHVTKVLLKIRADEAIEMSAKEADQSAIEESAINQSKESPGKKKNEKFDPIRGSESDSDSDVQSDLGVNNDNENVNRIDNSESDEINDQDEQHIEENGANDQEIQSDGGESSFRSANATLTEQDMSDTVWKPVSIKSNGVFDLPNQCQMRYRANLDDPWTTATVVGPGGKSTGKNKNMFNLTDDSGKAVHVKLDHCEIEMKDVAEDENDEEIHYFEDEFSPEGIFAVTVPKQRYNDPRVRRAMDTELEAWRKYQVYREVPDTGQKAVSTRWVVTMKGNDEYKARLVVRGFEEELEETVSSPTGDKSSIRIMITLAKAHGWKIESVDFKAAFLQSQHLDRQVYVRPPRNLKKIGIIWQLSKPAYGLQDSPRNWYNSLKDYLISIGCGVCRYDPGFFYYRVDNVLHGMICLHVDDTLVAGSTKFHQIIVKKILNQYDISKHVTGNFKYIGMNISQDKDFITVDQFDYAEKIRIVDLDMKRRLQKDSPLTSEEKTAYLSLLGKISWLSYISRPDLKWDVYNQSKKNKSPTVSDMLELNKVVSKLNVKKRIRYPRLDVKDGVKMLMFGDGSFGNLNNKVDSSRGYIIFLCSGSNSCCLAWSANKISRVVNSIQAAETLATIDGLNHCEWLRGILVDVLYGKNTDESLISIIGLTDSEQVYKSVHSTKHVDNHKLRRDVENLKERLKNGSVSELRWISKEYMLADPLTKYGADTKKLDYVLESGTMFNV